MTLPAERWREHAACIDRTDVFFVPLPVAARQPELWDEAKRICASCPVLSDCAEFVRRCPQPDGVWAGMTPRERGVKSRRRSQPRRSTAVALAR